MNFPADGLGSNYIKLLRHISRLVDLTLMINLSFNRDFLMLGPTTYTSLRSQVSLSPNRGAGGLRLVSCVLGGFQGDFYLHNLNVVLFVVACMCSYQQLLGASVRPLRPKIQCILRDLHKSAWHPFASESGPGQGMRVQSVIEEWRILLPYFVLFEDHLLFNLIGVLNLLS